MSLCVCFDVVLYVSCVWTSFCMYMVCVCIWCVYVCVAKRIVCLCLCGVVEVLGCPGVCVLMIVCMRLVF